MFHKINIKISFPADNHLGRKSDSQLQTRPHQYGTMHVTNEHLEHLRLDMLQLVLGLHGNLQPNPVKAICE